MIIRIRAKQHAEHLRVRRRARRPHVPDSVRQWIRDQVELGALAHVIGHVGRLRVGVLGGIHVLRGEEAHVLAPEHAAQRGGVMPGLEGLPVHGAFEGVVVFHHDGELGVVDAELGLWWWEERGGQ